jgi:hypothetical protein
MAARLSLLFALLAGAAAQAEPLLDAARWQHRLLVVTAPAADDPALGRQREQLADLGDDATTRDLVVVELAADAARATPAQRLPRPDAASLRDALALDRERFEVVLVGLDGGVKLRSMAPVPRCALLRTIDAMPMRRRESGDAAGASHCQD